MRVIPRIDKEEWQRLDVVARWLISTRAAVLLMTFISAALAGLFALRDGQFNLGRWALLGWRWRQRGLVSSSTPMPRAAAR